MRADAWACGLALLTACGGARPAATTTTTSSIPATTAAAALAGAPPAAAALRAPASFAAIGERAERAQALFTEASRVLLHPRCVNCHPDGDSPTQGDHYLTHDPPVARGGDDRGVPGLLCSSCHQDRNLQLARVPGAPEWHLAPRGMAWAGRSAHALCEQLKDPERNGHRTLAQIVDHSAHDQLVGWGWTPGWDRQPVPGTQAELGALMAAWAADGAACPPEEKK
jgi:hypothetical protein